MKIDLERYMASRYVNGGREWPNIDCWGMTRLAFYDLHAEWLPMLSGLDARSVLGKSKNYALLSKILKEVYCSDGAIAAVVTGLACEHVGICIEISGAIYVMETTEETGPRIIPAEEFEKERTNVRYYAPA